MGLLSWVLERVGSMDLEKAKLLWQQCVPYQDGVINNQASKMKSNPRVAAAKESIRRAAEMARLSSEAPRATINEAIAWTELGFLHRALNEFSDAEIALGRSLHLLDERSTRMDDDTASLSARREALFRLGELYHVRGALTAARRCYTDSLDLDRDLGHDDLKGEQATKRLLFLVDYQMSGSKSS